MILMIFMLFVAFDVVVQRPRCPRDHIDHITSHHPTIHYTWHLRSVASTDTAATTGGRHFACGGIFVVCSTVDDDKSDTNQSCLCPRRRLCRSLCRQRRRRYEFIQFAPAAVSFLFSLSLMMKTIQIHSILRLRRRLCHLLRR